METMASFIITLLVWMFSSTDHIAGIVIASLWLLYTSYASHKTIQQEKVFEKTLEKSMDFLRNAPLANNNLINAYVKVKGRIVTDNTLQIMLANNFEQSPSPCACTVYYIKKFGELRVKRKKPATGYKTITYVIDEQFSEKKIAIQTESGQRIICTPITFMKQGIFLSHESKNQKRLIQWAENNDEVTLFGRLIKRKSDFHLLVTNNKNYPSIFSVGDFQKTHDFFKRAMRHHNPSSSSIRILAVIWSGVLVIWSILIYFGIMLTVMQQFPL